MAAVTLVAPDGQRALPVFTGTEALAAWDPAARPVPVTPPGPARPRSPRAATSSSSTSPARRRGCCAPRWSGRWPSSVRGSPPHTDPFVDRSVAAAVRDEDDVTAHELEEGTPRGEGVLGVVLDLRPGLAAEQVARSLTRVGERLATDGELRARIDGLAFRLR